MMLRNILGVVAGLVAWTVIVTLLNFGLRLAIPDYHAAEATLQFTLAMKLGRLVEAAAASIGAGAVSGLVARRTWWPSFLVGFVLLCVFLPVHAGLWGKFPLWYHLAFLVPLVPLPVLGARLAALRAPATRKSVSI